MMDKQAVLDLYFAEARSKLIDLAAFLDRVERADGDADFRLAAFHAGLRKIATPPEDRPRASHARSVLTLLSDPTPEPLPVATTKSAVGAWPGFGQSDAGALTKV